MSVEMLNSWGFQLQTLYSEQPGKNYHSLEDFTVVSSGSVHTYTFTNKSGNVNIQFVHELQNLYFKEMNKELDITVPAFNFQMANGIE